MRRDRRPGEIRSAIDTAPAGRPTLIDPAYRPEAEAEGLSMGIVGEAGTATSNIAKLVESGAELRGVPIGGDTHEVGRS